MTACERVDASVSTLVRPLPFLLSLPIFSP
jgi:hypothetical protein